MFHTSRKGFLSIYCNVSLLPFQIATHSPVTAYTNSLLHLCSTESVKKKTRRFLSIYCFADDFRVSLFFFVTKICLWSEKYPILGLSCLVISPQVYNSDQTLQF